MIKKMTSQTSRSLISAAPAYGDEPCPVVFDAETTLFEELSQEHESAVTGGAPHAEMPATDLGPGLPHPKKIQKKVALRKVQRKVAPIK